MISLPFQAIDVVLKHADMQEEIYPLAAEEVRNQIYMGNVPGGASDVQIATEKSTNFGNFSKVPQ